MSQVSFYEAYGNPLHPEDRLVEAPIEGLRHYFSIPAFEDGTVDQNVLMIIRELLNLDGVKAYYIEDDTHTFLTR